MKFKFKKFNKVCENCGNKVLKRNHNFCTTCGYPTPKKLSEVEDPEELKMNTLRNNGHTMRHRVRFHGLINVMKELGMMSPEEAEDLTRKGNECLKLCLELKKELDKLDE